VSRWIDITRPMGDGMQCWPGRQPPGLSWEKRLEDGDHCNASRWTLNAHSGTHMDAPLHFVEGGNSIDQISPDVLVGSCRVIDLQTVEAEDLRGESRLLIRSAHSASGGVYAGHDALMSADTAQMLVAAGLQMIGTDRLSVDDSRGTDFALHHIFLGGNCVIIEGLSLAHVEPGRYRLLALPLRMEGAEASPARTLLLPVTP
jgi:arylformamidase